MLGKNRPGPSGSGNFCASDFLKVEGNAQKRAISGVKAKICIFMLAAVIVMVLVGCTKRDLLNEESLQIPGPGKQVSVQDLPDKKSDLVYGSNAVVSKKTLTGKNYKIELKGVTLLDFSSVLLGEVLNYPYVIENSVDLQSKLVDLVVNTEIRKKDLFNVVIQVMERSGLFVEDRGGVLYIFGKDTRLPLVREISVSCPLDFINAEQMKAFLLPLIATDDKTYLTTDGKRNLVICGESSRVARLLSVVRSLDRPVQQVISSIQVLEVTLADEMRYGLEYYLRAVLGGVSVVAGVLPGSVKAAPFYFNIESSDHFQSTINLLEKSGSLRVISRPLVMSSEGQPARFSVGTDIPILENTKSSDDSTIIQSVKYRNTGIRIAIIPYILSNNELSLEINVEVSKGATNETSGIDSPVILNRSISTNIHLLSGQSVCIAGLIQQFNENAESGIPGLRDYTKWLGSNNKVKEKTELVVILSPTISQTINNQNLSADEWTKIKGLSL